MANLKELKIGAIIDWQGTKFKGTGCVIDVSRVPDDRPDAATLCLEDDVKLFYPAQKRWRKVAASHLPIHVILSKDEVNSDALTIATATILPVNINATLVDGADVHWYGPFFRGYGRTEGLNSDNKLRLRLFVGNERLYDKGKNAGKWVTMTKEKVILIDDTEVKSSGFRMVDSVASAGGTLSDNMEAYIGKRVFLNGTSVRGPGTIVERITADDGSPRLRLELDQATALAIDPSDGTWSPRTKKSAVRLGEDDLPNVILM